MPKTTSPELFNLDYLKAAQQRSGTSERSLVDFSATSIVTALHASVAGRESPTVYLSGGGAHNSLLVEIIETQAGMGSLRRTEAIGIDGDTKEAILFALLANECLFHEPDETMKTPHGLPYTSMGKIYLPR